VQDPGVLLIWLVLSLAMGISLFVSIVVRHDRNRRVPLHKRLWKWLVEVFDLLLSAPP
jgi:hypothetical protein